MNKAVHLLAVVCVGISLTVSTVAQNATISPNENLVVDGVPAIPASLAETVERYSNFREASLAGWDPDRREMLVSTRFADVPQIHLVKMPGGARSQLTFYPDRVAGAQFNPKRYYYFVFIKDVGVCEFYQLYRYYMGSDDATLLTDGKSRNVDMVWAHGGDKVAYGSTRRDGDDVDIWVMNPADPKTDHMIAKLE